MRITVGLLPFVTTLLLVACTHPKDRPAAAARASACPVTETIAGPPPENTEGGPPNPEGSQPSRWHVNADRTIWMLAQPFEPRKRIKTAWFRSPRAELKVSGRRLDADASPMQITFPPADSYRHRFTPSSITFPTEGCWEITAKVDQHEARFVLTVPAKRSP